MNVSQRPNLTAHRGDTDETWRLARLEEVFEKARAIARGRGRLAVWDGAITHVHDHKGDLTVYWRSLWDFAWFSEVIRAAWRELGQYTRITPVIDFKGADPRKRLAPQRRVTSSRAGGKRQGQALR
jgi:hypothetical protein